MKVQEKSLIALLCSCAECHLMADTCRRCKQGFASVPEIQAYISRFSLTVVPINSGSN